MVYRICKRMLERGAVEGMEEKLDVFYAAGKLTDEEYAELSKMLEEKKEKADSPKTAC